MLTFGMEKLVSSGRRFSGELVHALLNGQTYDVHFTRLVTNGETPKELEIKVGNALTYQARKGKKGPEIREYLAILKEMGKEWKIEADTKAQVVKVCEGKV